MHVRGLHLSVERTGPPGAPAVVLLHAFPLSRRMWAHTAATLASAGYEAVTLDFRGFGHSTAPDGAYPMATLAEDVVAVVDQLGIQRAVFGGLSMGGYVLFKVLRQAPDLLRAALFMDTRAEPDSPEGREGRHQAADKIRSGPVGRDEYLNALIGKLCGATTLRERPAVVAEVQAIAATTSDAGLIGGLLGMAGRADHTATLGILRDRQIPALFLAGEEDGITSPEVARAMAARVPGAPAITIPASGHLPALEAPEPFEAALLDFLKRLPAG